MKAKGRFAPSPTGRMHLGNVASALISWLSAKSKGGEWLLRIEDLDRQRSTHEHARMIEDDLAWLGLEWDEGGCDGKGEAGPYLQSERGAVYQKALTLIEAQGVTYKCKCTRAAIMATQAPHQSDGRVVYGGACRPVRLGGCSEDYGEGAVRLWVPDERVEFCDMKYGRQSVNLSRHCGDFVLRRADGAWAYQLAVVADDAAMGITEVVRGSDLLLSSAQQIYLYRLLGHTAPEFGHVPLLCDALGTRLSKRHGSMAMDHIRGVWSPAETIGKTAWLLGLIPEPAPVTPAGLIPAFSWEKLAESDKICVDLESLFA